jgi:hypothetical protein
MRDGTLVIRGSALDSRELVVLVDGQPVPIVKVGAEQLLVLASANGPVPVEVVTDAGRASTREPVVPPVALQTMSEQITVVEGSTAWLQATVAGVADSRVIWQLEGQPPGVKLSPDGQLDVTLHAPDRFTVRADSVAAPGNAAVGTINVIAASAPVRQVGPRGGVVASDDGRARLILPPGALTEPIDIKLEPPRTRPATAGRPATTELRFEPRDLAVPALLEIALDHPIDPAVVPPIDMLRDGARFEIAARIDPDGVRLWLQLSHLPERLRVFQQLFHEAMMPSALSSPVIMRVDPTTIEEGDTVAVLIEGENFVPGATTVRLIDGTGAVDVRGECGAAIVSGNGRRVGVTIKVRPMIDLAEGDVSGHMLRVTTPAGEASHPLPILGHNELDVAAGQSVTVSSSRRLSRASVAIGGTLLLPGGTAFPIVLEVLSTASIAGTVRVTASNGTAGADGFTTGLGGSGGAAPLGAGGGGGSGADGASMGGLGRSGAATTRQPIAGAGGVGGTAGGSGIWMTYEGGRGRPGSSPPDPRFGSPGQTGFAFPLEPGAGGGGGGGGGGEGLIWKARGGGGGGGGSGAGVIVMSAGEGIALLNARVIAAGGDGGTGGAPLPKPAPLFIAVLAGGGGAGGGGGGGGVMLHGVDGGSSSFVIAVSGSTGPAPNATLGDLLTRPPTGDVRIDGFLIGASVPAHLAGPDLFYRGELVTGRTSIEVRGTDASHVRVTNGFGTTLLTTRPYAQVGPVIDPVEGVIPGLPSAGLSNALFVATVPLREGFNDIVAEKDLLPGEGLPVITSAPLRRRRVLHLPDAIPAYMFSCAINPASLVVPTERSADVQANVAASQATTLVWSLPSGPSFPPDIGTVAPLPNGARYTAPSRPPGASLNLRAASSLDPQRYTNVPITVVPGIALGSAAQSGTPRSPAQPSANAGQVVSIAITPAGLAATPSAFAGVSAIQTMLLRPGSAGCERVAYSVQATLTPGLQSLSFTVPSCADPKGWVRVPGHGSVELQIVPEITAITGNRAADPGPTIQGTGFACGLTEVLVDGAPAEIQSLSCSQIVLKAWPWVGLKLEVSTPGGTSNVKSVP